MFSVFRQPVFLFSDSRKSNYLGPKARGPGNRAGWGWGARAPGLRRAPARVCGAPPAPASSRGRSGCPQPLCWYPLPGVGTAGQGSTGGFQSK